jgi:hypothetical protein
MKTYTYCGKIIKTPEDLQPRGVRSTYNEEQLPFTETFERLWQLINTLR